jgi:hypothetical protein
MSEAISGFWLVPILAYRFAHTGYLLRSTNSTSPALLEGRNKWKIYPPLYLTNMESGPPFKNVQAIAAIVGIPGLLIFLLSGWREKRKDREQKRLEESAKRVSAPQATKPRRIER